MRAFRNLTIVVLGSMLMFSTAAWAHSSERESGWRNDKPYRYVTKDGDRHQYRHRDGDRRYYRHRDEDRRDYRRYYRGKQARLSKHELFCSQLARELKHDRRKHLARSYYLHDCDELEGRRAWRWRDRGHDRDSDRAYHYSTKDRTLRRYEDDRQEKLSQKEREALERYKRDHELGRRR